LRSKKAYTSQNLDFAQYAIAITSIDSNLDKLAKSAWLATFPMYDWVGGALRKCSAVCYQLPTRNRHPRHACRCARDGRRHPHTPDQKQPSCFVDTAGTLPVTDAVDMVVLPYKDSLLLFSRYLQQLVMESGGKKT